MEGVKVDINRTNCIDGYDVVFYYKSYNGLYVAKEYCDGLLEYKTHNRGHLLEHPTLRLSREEIEAFAEALNSINVKTESDSVLLGKYKATLFHLEDMRRIVSKNLNVKLVGLEKK